MSRFFMVHCVQLQLQLLLLLLQLQHGNNHSKNYYNKYCCCYTITTTTTTTSSFCSMLSILVTRFQPIIFMHCGSMCAAGIASHRLLSACITGKTTLRNGR